MTNRKPRQRKRRKANLVVSGQLSRPSGSPEVAVQMPRPAVTEFTRIVAVPWFSGLPRSGPAGTQGDYEVRFILGVPGISSVASEMKLRTLLHSGDSLVVGVAGDIEVLYPDGNLAGVATLLSNAQGHLSEVRARLTAADFAEAEQLAHDYVMPALSRIAFDVNVPLEVRAVIAVELATGTQAMSGTLVGGVQKLQSLEGWSTSELRTLLGVYREGLNSNAPLYQALSFFKIIEGVATYHTSRSRTAAKAGAAPPPDPLSLCMPTSFGDLRENPWAEDQFTPYLGKSYSDIRDAHKETIRNAVAHVTPGRAVRNPDLATDIDACRQAVPVLRHVARELLKKELERSVTMPAPEGTLAPRPKQIGS